MVIMAGMLPGVECARRRRIRQGAAEAPPCGTRRPSFCLYASGAHDHAHLASSATKARSGAACEEATRASRTLVDSNAREAKERLDQKLRSLRDSTIKRHHGHGTPGKSPQASSDVDGEHSALQREVFGKKGGGGGGRRRRFGWGRLGWKPAAEASTESEQAECAVCLEEFCPGDALVHLPCAHRFHWACAVPWVQAAARCPVCRAAVDLTTPPST